MRSLVIGFLIIMLSACGTFGGAISGAGRDLQRAGRWIDYNN
jgi:predicted small secreted protein